jgi:alpha-glucoside transport system substrate-binding protein
MKWLVVLVAFALMAAACGDDDDGADTTAAGGDDTTAAPEFEGTEVSIFGAFTSIEADAVNNVMDELIDAPTGMDSFYEGSESFEEQVKIRVEGGNPPDIALYPQPGSVVEQAARAARSPTRTVRCMRAQA